MAAFPGTGKIWMNGKLVEGKDATIHIASHVVHYGSGVFEGARCYATPRGSACFRLDAHMRRLQLSAKIYRMDHKWTIDDFIEGSIDVHQQLQRPRNGRPAEIGFGCAGVKPSPNATFGPAQ